MPSRRWVRDDWKQEEELCEESLGEQEQIWREPGQIWRELGNVERIEHHFYCCSEMTVGQNQCQ